MASAEADIRAIQRGHDLRARDVAGILHQADNARGADQLIDAFQAGTATDDELRELARIMRAVGSDPEQLEGLRSAAMEMYRTIEQRLLDRQPERDRA